MENTTNHLQAELERIESDARKHSKLISAAADVLDSAHELCQMINAKADLSTTPSISYSTSPDRCDIDIFGWKDSLKILFALSELNVQIVFLRNFGIYDKQFSLPDYPGVSLIISAEAAASIPCNSSEAA